MNVGRLKINSLGAVRRSSLKTWKSFLTPEYQDVVDAMTLAGAEPSNTDKLKQARLMKKLVDEGFYDDAELIDIFATQPGGSDINWRRPGTHDPIILPGAKSLGYEGRSGNLEGGYINTNFIPSADKTVIGVDDVQITFGIGRSMDLFTKYMGVLSEIGGVDVYSKTETDWQDPTLMYFLLNTQSGGLRSHQRYMNSRKKHLSMCRNADGTLSVYVNRVKLTNTTATARVEMDKSSFLGELNFKGGGAGVRDERPYRYYIVTKTLTEARTIRLIEIMEEYLDSVGTGLISDTPINIAFEGHSFMTNHAGWSRLSGRIADNCNAMKGIFKAVDGSSIASMSGRASALDAELSQVYRNVLVLYIGVNDMDNTEGCGTTAYNALKTYVQDRISAGWDDVLVYTMTPTTVNGRGAGFEAERVVFNDSLRLDLSTLPGVVILDTDGVTELGNSANATYFGDGLHFSGEADRIASELALNYIVAI